MERKWVMFIKVDDEKKRELLKKCAKICKVVLTDKGEDIFLVDEPMPDKENLEKFTNTLEERKIVSYISTETTLHYASGEEILNIYLSDKEFPNG